MILSSRPGLASTPLTNVLPLPSRAPERLVGVGFRCWLTGLTTGDIGCWEKAFNAFNAQLGPDRARTLLIELSQFVRAVQTTAERDIEVADAGSCGFCRDECLAISIIAACQHDARPALQLSRLRARWLRRYRRYDPWRADLCLRAQIGQSCPGFRLRMSRHLRLQNSKPPAAVINRPRRP